MITFTNLDLKDGLHLHYIRQKVCCVLCEDTRGLVALREGVVVGMYVLDSWTATTVQVHQAVDDPLVFKHGFHRMLADYVYGDAGRIKIIGLTPANNAEAIKLNSHYGFRTEARIEDGVDVGVDYLIMTMTADECRYFNEEAEHAA